MKLGPVTRETKNHQKKIDDGVMLATCDVIVIFPLYGQF